MTMMRADNCIPGDLVVRDTKTLEQKAVRDINDIGASGTNGFNTAIGGVIGERKWSAEKLFLVRFNGTEKLCPWLRP